MGLVEGPNGLHRLVDTTDLVRQSHQGVGVGLDNGSHLCDFPRKLSLRQDDEFGLECDHVRVEVARPALEFVDDLPQVGTGNLFEAVDVSRKLVEGLLNLSADLVRFGVGSPVD